VASTSVCVWAFVVPVLVASWQQLAVAVAAVVAAVA